MPARKFAPTIVLLTIVLTLIILAALACGPATPSAQDNVPPAESGATPTPEAGAARDLSLLDGLLRARVAEYEAAQAAQGVSGPATTPKMVGIHIAAASSESRREILSFLAEHGVTSPRTTGNAQIFADVPASLLAVLATRTDIDEIEADPLPYQNLGPDLSGLAVKYAAGLLPDEDTEPTFARLVILIEGNDNYDAIRRFLDNGGAVMAYGDQEMEDAYKPLGMLVAYVPVKLFAELDEKPGVFDIRAEIYPVPERMRIPERYPAETPSSPPSGSSGEGQGATGQDNVPPAESGATPTPEAGAARDLSLLDGLLRARVAEYEATQAARGVSGPATTPKMVGIHIAAASSESRREILSLLAEHGVTSPRTTGNAQIFVDVPASLLAVLATRTDIDEIEADPLPYQNLGPDLSGLAVKYAAGLLPDEDTEPTFARLVILIEGNDNYDAIRRFLDNGGAVMAFGDQEMEDAYKPIGMLVAYVPVKLFAELDEKPGVFDIRPEIYPVPERMRIPARYPSETPYSPPSGSSGEGQGATGQDNVPPAESGATPTPEAGSARDLSLLDGLLRARVAEYEATQAARGISGPATTPKMVGIHISAASSESRREILSFLAEHGVTSPRTTGNAQIFADVPAYLLAVLATRTDINKIEADPLPYQNLGPDISGLAVKYAAGLLPDEDTEPTFARLVILIEGNDNYDAIRRFLDNGGAVMAYGDQEMEDAYKPIGMLVAYVPVKLFAELDEKPGVFDIRPEIYPVPERMRIPERYPSATPSSPPSGSSGEGQGATGAAAVPPATPTRTGGAVAHGASDAGGASGQAEPTPAPDSGEASGQGSAPGQNAPTPTPPPPAQNNPSGLTAVVENGAVTLFWMPRTNPNYVKQVVKRREPGVRPAVWTDFELDASADTYTDTTVESGKSYIYRVKGLKANDTGGTSNRVVIAVP